MQLVRLSCNILDYIYFSSVSWHYAYMQYILLHSYQVRSNGGGSYLSGFDLEFCTCKHAPPKGDLGACSPRKFLEDTCSEINTETASFEPNIMLQSDKRQKKKNADM